MAEGRERLRVGSFESPVGPSPPPGHPSDTRPFGVLGDTRVGRMPSQILLDGGSVEDESELEEIVLWPPEEEEAESSEGSEEEDGPGPQCIFLCFCFFLLFFLLFFTFRGRG